VLGTLQHLNRIDIDPSGRFAVVWFDLVKAVATGGLTGIGSFQDVTVIALDPGAEKAVNLTVGFRPRAVQFDATGNRAYVITQDGVSVIDLGYATAHEATIIPPIPVADPAIPVEDLEVQVVATGEYAAVRQAGASQLRIVSVGVTNPGQVWTIPLASPATDIDLAPDGTRVYAVERDAQALAVVDVPGDAFDPSGVETVNLADAAIGSLQLSADGKRGILFTNASLDPRISLIALDQPGYPHVTWPLKKSVLAVAIAPTSDSALVVNAKEPGDPATATSVDEYIAESYGYTLVDLASGFGKLQLTPVNPGSLAYSFDGSKAYVAQDGGDAATATRAIDVITVRTGVVETMTLGSPPTSVGVLPGIGTAFASQRHPLGRITFVDVATDAVRTVTGFDLNSHIVN
jgi:DNA-binding beta-propeller fold protein YncE